MQHQRLLLSCRIAPAGAARIVLLKAGPFSGGHHAADGLAGTEVVS